MKYRQSFLVEVERFERCQGSSQGKTELGLRQFFEFESKGKKPEKPDPYFQRLVDGKKWWEWTLNYIADTYMTAEWVGWYCYARDFQNDESGFKQLRQRCNCDPLSPNQLIESTILPYEFFLGSGI